nr:flt3-interacting zinc finger protein 1-like [Penaeus vannamei]
MDSTQQLLVDNNQQQFLVDGSQPLLVFPETANTPYSELAEAPDPEPEQPDPEHQPQPEVIMVQEKMDEHEEEERIVEKPFRCDDCGKSFAKKQYLTKHKYRHREVKPHACDVCGKRFAQKFEVAVHKIKHTGERRFQCDVCCKPFRSKLQLERHVTLHTGSHPYKCSICQRGYTQRINLVKHLAKTHDIVDASQIEAMNSMENAEAVETWKAWRLWRCRGDGWLDVVGRAGGGHGTGHQAADVPQAAYSVVEVHPEGLKEYLLAGPQVVSTHDMDPKLLQSILQQVRAAPDDSHITTIADSQAVVHVTAMDE